MLALLNVFAKKNEVSQALFLEDMRDFKFADGKVNKIGSSDSMAEPKICLVISLDD